MCLNRDLNPNRDWDLPITAARMTQCVEALRTTATVLFGAECEHDIRRR